MSGSERYDVVIAGAGLVGASLALALSRVSAGDLRICLVGRHVEGQDGDVRASAITAGSQRMLSALGVWPDLVPDAQAVARIEITDTSLDNGVRPVLTRYENTLAGGEPATFIVPNAALESALRRAVAIAPSVTMLDDTANGCRADDAHIAVPLASGRVLTAGLAVAADGRRSRLREAAAIGVVVLGGGQTGIVTRIRHEIPHEGVAVQHFLPGGPFAMLPLVGDRCCITWSERDDEARRVLALDDAGFLDELDRRIAGRLGVIALDGPRQRWPLSTQLARSYVAPRLALAGDAGHGVHPIAGQGLNLGFRDVAALVEVLADGLRVGLDPGDATLLQRYERWRRFDSFASAAAFEGLNRLFSNDITLLRSIREVGLGLVDRLPAVKSLLVREAAGLTGHVPLLLKGELPG